jgi:hypothetical protein
LPRSGARLRRSRLRWPICAGDWAGQLQQFEAAFERRDASGWPGGGQKGHKGGTLRQVAVPDCVVRHEACVCRHCRSRLEPKSAIGVETRQVFGLPERPLMVTEHQASIYRCAPVLPNRRRRSATSASSAAIWRLSEAINSSTSAGRLIPPLIHIPSPQSRKIHRPNAFSSPVTSQTHPTLGVTKLHERAAKSCNLPQRRSRRQTREAPRVARPAPQRGADAPWPSLRPAASSRHRRWSRSRP